MSFAPEKYHKIIVQAFTDTQQPAYCQAGTVDEKGNPQLRTVHMHYLKEMEALAFNTHVQSAKWRHLQLKPILSGCYMDIFHQIQFRWESRAALIDPDDKHYESLLNEMWLKMREDVRKAYCLDDLHLPLSDPLPPDTDIRKRRTNHSVVLCKPYLWNIYEINVDDYTKSHCTLHLLDERKKTWHSQTVSILHGKEEVDASYDEEELPE